MARTFGYFLANSDDKPAAAQRLLAIMSYCRRHPDLSAEPYVGLDSTALESRSLRSRPDGWILLRSIRRGDHVVVHVADLGHGAKDFRYRVTSILRDGVTLHLIDDEAEPLVLAGKLDAKTQGRLDKLISRVAAEVKARRIRERMAEIRAQGKPISSMPPFGYTMLRMPGGPVLAASKADRYWTRKILEWREAGWTRMAMLQELHRRRAKTARGTPWTFRRLRRVLSLVKKSQPSWLAST